MNLPTFIALAAFAVILASAILLRTRRKKTCGPCDGCSLSSVCTPSKGRRILLHCCCAPCSGAIIEWMVQHGMRPVVFFSNSNIVPKDEYDLRKAEVKRYCRKFSLKVVDDDYDHGAWLSGVRGLEDEPERGRRCLQCFKFRLLRAAEYASRHGFDTLATTLASSRWKSLEQVNEAGEYACSRVKGVVWWGRDWRKGGLQPRRSEIIKEQGFYNQTFCGCEFSRKRQ